MLSIENGNNASTSGLVIGGVYYWKIPYLMLLHILVFRIKQWVKELILPFMKSWPKKRSP